ncbi:MAG: 30S ribosomal protein S20 [Lachnospiraceae bacterium]
MANIKSAKKRIKVIETKTARNKAAKSKLKTILKKFDQAVASGDKAAAEAQLKVCTSELSKAVSKGILHKNTVSRKVSRLAAKVNKMA